MLKVSMRQCTPHSIAIGYLLRALLAEHSYDYVHVAGLPDQALSVPDREVLLAVTAAVSPMFRSAVAEAASSHSLDVIMMRVAEPVGGRIRVWVDLALGSLPCATWVENDLQIWSDATGVWLVPEGFGPTVSLGRDGCALDIVPPYASLAEREQGIARAETMLGDLLRAAEGRR